MPNEISIFTPAFNPTPSGKMTIEDFLNGVRFGKWKDEVEKIRNEPEKGNRKLLKEKVVGVTISGLVHPTRLEKNHTDHSGFICIDIDGYTDREQLLVDQYTYAIFSSISGSGLAVLVRINIEKHKESFKWLQEYYFKTYGIVVDPAPQNPASLRFVTYDPSCFINEQAKVAKHAVKKQPAIKSLPIILPEDKVGQIINECVSRGINIAEDYHSYMKLGFALAGAFGERGRPYFHALSGVSSKYNSRHCDTQYTACLRHDDGNTSIGVFYAFIKQAGVELPKNEKYENAVRIVSIAKKAGRTKEGVAQQLTELNEIPPEDARRIADEVYARGDITLSAIASDPEKLIESLVSWMQINYPMKKNTITGKIENIVGEITKEMMNTIYLQARSSFNTPNVTFDLIERIMFSNFTPEYNPIKDYIDKNSHRTTTGNISALIKSINSPTKDVELFIRKWLISLGAAVDGYPVRLVLALCGKQKTGKTEWYRRLLPADLKKYYGESKMEAGKDDELLMTQKLIIMDDEMSGKNKTDEKRFKDLTSKHTFSLRAPYDRSNMDYRRIAVLCGTSNDLEVINDPTGNTRILPIEVTSIDYEAYNAIDKDELFMEIIRTYESGENWNFSDEDQFKLDEASNTFEAIAYERELILKYFTCSAEVEGNGFIEEMSATEIKNYIEERTKQQIRSLKRLGMELHSIFGERKSVRKAGKVLNVYSVVKIQDGVPAQNGVVGQYEKVKDDADMSF